MREHVPVEPAKAEPVLSEPVQAEPVQAEVASQPAEAHVPMREPEQAVLANVQAPQNHVQVMAGCSSKCKLMLFVNCRLKRTQESSLESTVCPDGEKGPCFLR